MRPFLLATVTCLGILFTTAPARAQDEPPAPAAEEPPATSPVEPAAAAKPGSKAFWSDVIVVPRRGVLKSGRFELAPVFGLSLNDPLIQHFAFGGQMNFFFSEVFSVGLEGNFFRRRLTDLTRSVQANYDRLPTINEIKWSAALNFGYAPVYGKFAVLNKSIIHWEALAIGGVGITRTEVIPRYPSDVPFSNYDITPNLGIGARAFVKDWFSVFFQIRDYIYPDKFEKLRRMGDSAEKAASEATTQIVNNVMLMAGVSFFLPPSFQYHTAR